MSILSGAAIHEAVSSGRIQIEGYDPKYLNPASYDLTLGSSIGVYADPFVLDAKQENVFKTEGGFDKFQIQPGRLYLMHTAEKVGTKDLVPVLDGKSSIARLGVCIHLTAGFGDPGFFGQYTLEVTCVRPVILYAGMRIAQMRFHTMEASSVERTTLGVSGIAQYAGNYVGATAEGPVPSMSWKQFSK